MNSDDKKRSFLFFWKIQYISEESQNFPKVARVQCWVNTCFHIWAGNQKTQ